ncbi:MULTISPECIES: hypothetical protein [unclassified Micromonospora]|uniref:hypothetical protein n=1 Tax=unclassified Micromonospora TaxID=2617518 RepID=UPI002FF2A533
MRRDFAARLLGGRTDDGSSVTGVIGERRLIAVQTVDIARLTTHPVPIVPGSFIAVTGQGPKADSNGSGKTTFLSAVSLLHCDSQWRLDVDGRHAAGLLFRPGAAGLDASGGGADHGYVIGVFAHGAAGNPSGLVTVWVRISRKPPLVLMRHVSEFHVLRGVTDQERSDQADDLWEQMPRSTERGSRDMASTLFGNAPRCLAYLDSTLRPSVPSLLSQQMTQMSPDRIGEALIALTGRDQLLHNEVEVRRKHADQLAVLDSRAQEDKRDRLVEDAQLEELRRRESAREALAEADRCWNAYLAQGFIEKSELHQDKTAELERTQELLRKAETVLREKKAEYKECAANAGLADAAKMADDSRRKIAGRRSAAQEAIGRLTATIDSLRGKSARLQVLAEGDDTRPVGDHTVMVEAAEAELVTAKARHRLVEERLQQAKKDLQAAQEGREGSAGHAVAILEGIVEAVPLLDVLTVSDSSRASWEPRLWRHRDAVVVAPRDEARALEELQAVPGASLVLADGPLHGANADGLPEGLTSSVPLSNFLRALEDRLEFRGEPPHVRDDALSEAVLGGFASPFVGREARINLARAGVSAAEGFLASQGNQVAQAALKLKHERRLLEAADAAAQLVNVTKEIRAAETALGIERERESTAESEWIEADDMYTAAKSALDNHEGHLSRLASEVKECEEKKGELVRDERAAVSAVDRVQINLWRDTWHRPYQAATALMEGEGRRRGKHTAAWWLAESKLSLKEALTYTANDPNGPTSREEPAFNTGERSDGFDLDAPDPAVFATRTRQLRDLLDSTVEKDAVLQDRIYRSREKREREVEETQAELELIGEDLKKQQDMVETSVDTALRKISMRLDQLDTKRGYGARLDIVITRPIGPEDSWGWHVTPKWKRSPAGGYISYKEVANSAQVKIFAIQLVLAALLADDSVPARLLILDELGNSLGDANRKDVLSALNAVAREQDITILGTCQDSVIHDAAGVCGEILWFCHASASEPYNRPTRAWGFDADHRRVDLIAPWLHEGREEA